MKAALILAADIVPEESKRQPIDDIGGASSLKRLIMVFRQAEIKKIVVITGHDSAAMEKHCGHMGVVFLHNENYKTAEKLSSVKIGLDYLKNKCTGVFITPVHIPFFAVSTLELMSDYSSLAVVPAYNNKPGYPILLSESLFDTILNYGGSGGIRDALSSREADCLCVEVPDKGILADARKRVNVSGLIENQGLREVRPGIKLTLSAEKGFFGPGALQLLSLTQETGSLKHAAKRMGLSYSKAINLIVGIEKQIGFQVLVSRQGGSEGGGSVITKRALDLMKRYEAFEAECNELIKGLFDKYFQNLTE